MTDAYDYTDLLKEKLNKNGNVVAISKEFNKISDNSERVKFLEKLLIQYSLIPKIKDFHKPKSNKIAVEYRNQGNQFYKNRQFLYALEFYNKSLCFAEKNDENIGTAFANRSAIYCELKLYKRALKNIELAIENKYSEKNLDKLIKRKNLCEECIKNDVEETFSELIGEEYLKISHDTNPNIPYIANCLKLNSNEKFGRYITTDKNLSTGDIVAIEEPFSKALLPKKAYQFCVNCMRDNFLDLLPCNGCTAFMFCSEECRDVGMKKFHNYECKIIDVLNRIYTKIMRIANHTFYEALFLYNNNVEQLMDAMNENENLSVTVYDFNLENCNKQQILRAIDSLNTNEKDRSSSDLFQRAGIVAIMTHFLLNFTDMKQILDTEEKKDFYRRFAMKQTQISALNYHGVFDGLLAKEDIEKNDQIGSGSYPFCSLINHSCAPNLVRVTHKCKNYVMINRPIQAGEQLFDNYGYHHCLETLRERQGTLSSQYMFKCTCEACKFNYPLYPNLRYAKDESVIEPDDISDLQNLNSETAKKKFKDFCNTLDNLDKNGCYPCSEISTLQECLLRCMLIFKMTKFNLKFLK